MRLCFIGYLSLYKCFYYKNIQNDWRFYNYYIDPKAKRISIADADKLFCLLFCYLGPLLLFNWIFSYFETRTELKEYKKFLKSNLTLKQMRSEKLKKIKRHSNRRWYSNKTARL